MTNMLKFNIIKTEKFLSIEPESNARKLTIPRSLVLKFADMTMPTAKSGTIGFQSMF